MCKCNVKYSQLTHSNLACEGYKVFAALERYKNGYTNYVICLCHSVWMFLSLSMALSQSLLSGKSSVFFLHCIPVGICCLSWNSHGTKYEKIGEGGLKKTHHIKLRDVLVHSRVGEKKKKIAEDEGGEMKRFFHHHSSCFPREELDLMQLYASDKSWTYRGSFNDPHYLGHLLSSHLTTRLAYGTETCLLYIWETIGRSSLSLTIQAHNNLWLIRKLDT